ncbi:MAG: NADPH2 dehydrogenase [Planctomycetota bacterium]|jgi:NADPH2 dehydrogenase
MQLKFRTPGSFKKAEEFRAHIQSLDSDFDCDTSLEAAAGPFGEPISVAGKSLTNRFAIHPMEGWDGTTDGLPTEPTLRRWRRFGQSSASLIWGGEAVAVQPDGRANPNQLCFDPRADTATGLARLLEELQAGRHDAGVEDEGCVVGLQLTHSGRFARPEGANTPLIPAHHPVLDERFGITENERVLSDAELEAIGDSYVRAAVCAQELGYDFVDVKCCHGYLMHELLGARTRAGSYGGGFEGRTLLLRRIIEGIRQSAPGLVIGVRVSIVDVFPHVPNKETRIGEPRGWDIELPAQHGFGIDPADPRRFDMEEPLRFLSLLQSMDVKLINISAGSPYYCPHLQRPASYPPSDGYLPPVDPLLNVLDHLRVARSCKEAFPDMTMVGSGYSYLQEWLPHVAQHELRNAGVDFIGLGRMVLSYPEMPIDVLAAREIRRRQICRTFSDCTTAPRNGIASGCYPLDPYYKSSPMAAELKAWKSNEKQSRMASERLGQ